MASLLGGLFRPRAERSEARDVGAWDVPWSNRGVGTSVSQSSAYNLSGVWACQSLIADSIATLPVGTYRKTGQVREPTTAPAWIETPNPLYNRVEYETMRLLSLLGWGNAYTLLIRKGGSSDPAAPVIERWALSPDNVSVRKLNPIDVASPISYYVKGQLVPNGNIQHVRGYTLPGWYLGMSVIENARRSLGMAFDAETAGENFYSQGMMLGGVLEVPAMPADASKDVLDRLREEFSARYSGASNSGKPAVLTGGTKWSPITVTPSDAQFLETRRFQLNEICRWFRVPPHKVNDIVQHASQGGGNGLEQQSIDFAQDTLLPWTVRLEQADSALIPRGQFVKYSLDAYVRTDLTTRYSAYEQARNAGFLSVNEIRAYEDRPPIPNGDVYLQPLNYVEAGYVPPEPTPPPPDVAPVVDATPPQQNSLTVSPVVNVDVHPSDVTVEQPDVNVDARQEPPVVNVTTPDVRVEPATVNVTMPNGRTVRRVERDEAGFITRTIEEPD